MSNSRLSYLRNMCPLMDTGGSFADNSPCSERRFSGSSPTSNAFTDWRLNGDSVCSDEPNRLHASSWCGFRFIQQRYFDWRQQLYSSRLTLWTITAQRWYAFFPDGARFSQENIAAQIRRISMEHMDLLRLTPEIRVFKPDNLRLISEKETSIYQSNPNFSWRLRGRSPSIPQAPVSSSATSSPKRHSLVSDTQVCPTNKTVFTTTLQIITFHYTVFICWKTVDSLILCQVWDKAKKSKLSLKLCPQSCRIMTLVDLVYTFERAIRTFFSVNRVATKRQRRALLPSQKDFVLARVGSSVVSERGEHLSV